MSEIIQAIEAARAKLDQYSTKQCEGKSWASEEFVKDVKQSTFIGYMMATMHMVIRDLPKERQQYWIEDLKKPLDPSIWKTS